MAQKINEIPSISEIPSLHLEFSEGQAARDISEIPSLHLAFLGDAVYELILREYAVEHYKGNVDSLNKKKTEYSKAKTQARMVDILLGKAEGSECILTEEEQTVLRRGRNAKSVSLPKSCTPSEYRKATGFEALIGYLYLMDQKERITEIITYGIEKYKNQ